MDRREAMTFIGMAGAAATMPCRSSAQEGQPSHAISQWVYLASDAFETPRWDGSIKVHGFLLVVKAFAPNGMTPFFLNCAPKISRERGLNVVWKPIPIVERYTNYYKTAYAQEWIKIADASAIVSFFFPFAALSLREGSGDIRFEFVPEIARERNNVTFMTHFTPTMPFPVDVRTSSGRVVVTGRTHGAQVGEQWTTARLVFLEDKFNDDRE